MASASVLLLLLPAAAAVSATHATAGCSLYAGCPWDKFPFKCSNPAPAVLYEQIKHYSPEVTCGNLFLESDIGGGINIEPLVLYTKAEDDKFYTLVMVDPDATTLSFPEATAPGAHAPVRHWIAGNIPGAGLKIGDFHAATTVSPFHGPSPPTGSHRYGQFIFAQPKGVIDFTVGGGIFPSAGPNFDYLNWTKFYDLGQPVASNWHVTLHSDNTTSKANLLW